MLSAAVRPFEFDLDPRPVFLVPLDHIVALDLRRVLPMDYRYPEYSKAEKKWKQELKKLKLPNNITVSHSPFFEKNHLFLSIQLKNKSEFKDLISKA